MGTKSVRLDESVYERIAAHKQDDETFSEAIVRLIDDWSLLELTGTYTEGQADRHRELLRQSEATGLEEQRAMLEGMGIDLEDE